MFSFLFLLLSLCGLLDATVLDVFLQEPQSVCIFGFLALTPLYISIEVALGSKGSGVKGPCPGVASTDTTWGRYITFSNPDNEVYAGKYIYIFYFANEMHLEDLLTFFICCTQHKKFSFFPPKILIGVCTPSTAAVKNC